MYIWTNICNPKPLAFVDLPAKMGLESKQRQEGAVEGGGKTIERQELGVWPD